MSRLRHEKGVSAGAGSGIHRLKVDKPLPFKSAEERKCGGKIEGGSSRKLGRKRGGSVGHGTDIIPHNGTKLGTPVQETKMSGPGHIEDSLKHGGAAKHWIQGAIKHPGAEKRAAKKAGESTHEYMESHKGDSGKSGARARLGLRLSAMAKHKKD